MTLFGVFGNIPNPFRPLAFDVPQYNQSSGQGMIVLISNLYKLVIVVAGIYTLFNFVLSGYAYMGASGDPKLLQKAQERMWKSILGLIIVAGSVLIAAIIGFVVFGPDNWNILISPKIFTP
jgi:hypothetical protein